MADNPAVERVETLVWERDQVNVAGIAAALSLKIAEGWTIGRVSFELVKAVPAVRGQLGTVPQLPRATSRRKR